MSRTDLPTPERLRELLDYDPETGVLTWRSRPGHLAWNRRYAGHDAGTLRTDGYIAVKVEDVIHPAHQLIWAIVHGQWADCVRHRNRNDADNRLVNLRGMSRGELEAEVAAERRSRDLALAP